MNVILADLGNPTHQRTVLSLIDEYSQDHYGDGKPLNAEVKDQLIRGLQNHPTTEILVAFNVDVPIGIAVCFRGFSTFAAKPLLNIHDFFVRPTHRGRGVAHKLLEAVELRAVKLGCCKLTLEVLDKNDRALRTYERAGFVRYTLQAGAGEAIFLAKTL